MGIGVLLALLMMILSLIGQSPRFMRKVGLDIYRLDLRVRAFTGYALAFLLITIGFFLAGVPLDGATGVGAALIGDTATPAGAATGDAGDTIAAGTGVQVDETENGDSILPSATFTRPAANNTPVTGAFGGPPPGAGTATSTGEATDAAESAGQAEAPTDEPAVEATTFPTPPGTTPSGSPAATPTDRPVDTATATPSPTPSAIPTETPAPTATPTPTLTPTPIAGATALVDSNGSNVWVYRSPGGQQLTLVADGDLVILLSGHAHQGGVLWQEIMTVDGEVGWIEASFLVIDGEEGA